MLLVFKLIYYKYKKNKMVNKLFIKLILFNMIKN
jgi:hypothetical protein